MNNDVLRDLFKFLNTKLPHLDESEVNSILTPQPPKEFVTMSVKELKIAVSKANLTSSCIGFSEKREFIELLESHYKAKHIV